MVYKSEDVLSSWHLVSKTHQTVAHKDAKSPKTLKHPPLLALSSLCCLYLVLKGQFGRFMGLNAEFCWLWFWGKMCPTYCWSSSQWHRHLQHHYLRHQHLQHQHHLRVLFSAVRGLSVSNQDQRHKRSLTSHHQLHGFDAVSEDDLLIIAYSTIKWYNILTMIIKLVIFNPRQSLHFLIKWFIKWETYILLSHCTIRTVSHMRRSTSQCTMG